MTDDLLGFAAGAAVLTCFWMRDQRRLRSFGILSNILFILYGGLTGMMPILILHAVLLPLNMMRLAQLSGARECDEPKTMMPQCTRLDEERRRLLRHSGLGIQHRPAPGFTV